MINLGTLTLCILIAYCIGILITKKRGLKEYALFDDDHTNALKGFSILTIVWAHEGISFGVQGLQFIAGIGVSLFLVCSGYGLMYSYRKNGLKNYWRKRIVRVLVPWLIAEMVLFMLNMTYNVQTLRSFYSYKNMNWFIKYIFAMYLLFWCGSIVFNKLKLSGKKLDLAIVLIALVCFVIDSLWLKNPAVPFLHARQMLSFPLGIFIYKYKNEIEVAETNNRKPVMNALATALLMIGMGFQLILQMPVFEQINVILSNLCYLITNMLLTLAVLIYSVFAKKLFENKFLIITGVISYEIFLIHLFSQGLIDNSMEVVIYLGMMYALVAILYEIDKKIKNMVLA